MQTIEQAKSYFKRKVKFVTEQMEKVQMIGIEKSQVRDGNLVPSNNIMTTFQLKLLHSFFIAVAEVMELKVQAQVAANPQQAPVRA